MNKNVYITVFRSKSDMRNLKTNYTVILPVYTVILLNAASVYSVCLRLFHYLNFLQVDPVRTISAGKVNIGAFRTYPKVCNH